MIARKAADLFIHLHACIYYEWCMYIFSMSAALPLPGPPKNVNSLLNHVSRVRPEAEFIGSLGLSHGQGLCCGEWPGGRAPGWWQHVAAVVAIDLEASDHVVPCSMSFHHPSPIFRGTSSIQPRVSIAVATRCETVLVSNLCEVLSNHQGHCLVTRLWVSSTFTVSPKLLSDVFVRSWVWPELQKEPQPWALVCTVGSWFSFSFMYFCICSFCRCFICICTCFFNMVWVIAQLHATANICAYICMYTLCICIYMWTCLIRFVFCMHVFRCMYVINWVLSQVLSN